MSYVTRLNSPRQESISSSESSLRSKSGHVAIIRHTKHASSEVSKAASASGNSFAACKHAVWVKGVAVILFIAQKQLSRISFLHAVG